MLLTLTRIVFLLPLHTPLPPPPIFRLTRLIGPPRLLNSSDYDDPHAYLWPPPLPPTFIRYCRVCLRISTWQMYWSSLSTRTKFSLTLKMIALLLKGISVISVTEPTNKKSNTSFLSYNKIYSSHCWTAVNKFLPFPVGRHWEGYN